ncbi:hypothetical protein C6Y39_12065 [Alteromonas gracilis]|uniref:Uncharacterized protein n=1 Tax=Alteromonas gracilis TaxID=1479524 RepID=A0ABX5CPK0_9ALTE|nr:hypothetical protein C6Y39_12065 [Alteromonas gracilis]
MRKILYLANLHSFMKLIGKARERERKGKTTKSVVIFGEKTKKGRFLHQPLFFFHFFVCVKKPD